MLLRRYFFEASLLQPKRRQSRTPKAPEKIQEYQDFVIAAGTQIGELSPLADEDVGDIRTRIRLAARQMGCEARTWVDDGKVYFYIRHDNVRLS
jgi:hypothetical protein